MAARTYNRFHRRKESFFPAICFLGASVIVAAWIVSKNAGPVQKTDTAQPILVAEFDTIPLPVPAKPVPLGAKGKDIVFKFVSFPRQQIPEGAIKEITSISEMTTTSILPAELPLFESNFSKNASFSNPVVERIPAGMRAMTLRVDATVAVEGWAGSGSLVDVLLITKEHTKVIGEKIRILSAERSVAPVEGSGLPNVPSTITVLVSQEQCLAINTAIPLGKIAFALRSSQDEQRWNDTVYTAERLKGSSTAREEKKAHVSGFVSIKGDEKQFAFSEGRWVKTDSVPNGFLVGREAN